MVTRRVSVLLCAALAALTVACGSEPAGSDPGSGPASSGSTGSGSAGDAAVWGLGPDPRLAPRATTFTALVSRLGCNDEVPFDVDLGEPLGERALVDGACLPGGAAVTTAFCVDGPTRFKP